MCSSYSSVKVADPSGPRSVGATYCPVQSMWPGPVQTKTFGPVHISFLLHSFCFCDIIYNVGRR